MLFSIMRSEWFKLQKSKVSSIIMLGPALGFIMGYLNNEPLQAQQINGWFIMFMYNSLVYGLLFLPLMTGVLAGTICRYEHQAGGWKQLLSMPVTRNKAFIAKYLILILLVLLIQFLYLSAMFVAGMIKGIPDPFPIEIALKSILGGWIATFPLLALQLWMSIIWKSFAAPFTVNVIFTLPSIMAVNSETFGPIYPWAQPFLIMHNFTDNMDTLFYVPTEQVLTIVGGSFLLFFLGGLIYFRRKELF